jgi:hypothetical protein
MLRAFMSSFFIKTSFLSYSNGLTESIAVGSKRFVEATKDRLGIKAKERRVLGEDGSYEVREPAAAYGRDFGPKNGSLSLENTYSWNVYPEILMR